MRPLAGLVDRLEGVETLYDGIQLLAGADLIRRRLRPHLADAGGQLVLDVGAGTGLYASACPPGARHLWLDTDVRKLRRFRARGHEGPALLSDATAIGLTSQSVDVSVCTNMTHHLDDAQLMRFLRDVARVTRRRVIIEDPLDRPDPVSRGLWAIDRGSYPRTGERLLDLVSSVLRVEHTERFTRFHTYLLIVASPPSVRG